MVICVNHTNKVPNNSANDNYISLHKFLANYKPNVVTDEQVALAKPESIYVKNNK
jgi:hypothetical protein